ncbi:MAG: radical SAM protein [Candidatus Fibromonas sp.]|jgi:DNA repair photolyase|nr:radical SAM protein [Candidatus Fibromonas sp.]
MIIKEVECGTAITKSKSPGADYVVNSYTGCTHKCIYCYAEYMKKFTNHSAEEWGEFIDIKVFDKIKIPKDIENKHVLISSVTDPYNFCEMKYEKTKQILEELKGIDCHVEILTKSKNVLRDVELFKQFKSIEVGVSLNTVDDDFRKSTEPRASSVEDRIDVLKTLRENSIRNYLSISPIFPYLTDCGKIIEQTRDFVDYYGFENLNIRSEYKAKVLDLIKQNYGGNLHNDYINIYKSNNPIYWNFYWKKLEKEIVDYCEKNSIKYKMCFYHEKIRKK